MAPIPRIPHQLRDGPFSRGQALGLGMRSRQLEGAYLHRLFPRVYVHRDHAMTQSDWILAASLAMPERAQLSHITRIQALGLEFGRVRPFRFTVAGDLHLDLADIFLHRTEILPPLDEQGVTPAAAFIQYCATARMIDAIKVGDWLLRGRHMSTIEVGELARHDHWRPGAKQVRRVIPHLDAAARSLKESETRALVRFAGFPPPEINVDLVIGGRWLGCVDLLLRAWMLVLEYEGRQHAETPVQFRIDIERYARFREESVAYIQITNEMLGQPQELMMRIHRALAERGFDGDAPVFGRRWKSLFRPITVRAVE